MLKDLANVIKVLATSTLVGYSIAATAAIIDMSGESKKHKEAVKKAFQAGYDKGGLDYCVFVAKNFELVKSILEEKDNADKE